MAGRPKVKRLQLPNGDVNKSHETPGTILEEEESIQTGNASKKKQSDLQPITVLKGDEKKMNTPVQELAEEIEGSPEKLKKSEVVENIEQIESVQNKPTEQLEKSHYSEAKEEIENKEQQPDDEPIKKEEHEEMVVEEEKEEQEEKAVVEEKEEVQEEKGVKEEKEVIQEEELRESYIEEGFEQE